MSWISVEAKSELIEVDAKAQHSSYLLCMLCALCTLGTGSKAPTVGPRPGL